MACISVFGQAAAAVLAHTRQARVQFHDYHGTLSLLHLPASLRPSVLYTAHNAHYNAEFPIATEERRVYVLAMMGLLPRAMGGAVGEGDVEAGKQRVEVSIVCMCVVQLYALCNPCPVPLILCALAPPTPHIPCAYLFRLHPVLQGPSLGVPY